MRSPFSDQKPSDIFIQELGIGGIAAAAGGVSPQRRDRRWRDRGHESGFVAGVADREVEVGFRWHVEEWYFDGTQRLLDVAVKAGRFAYVVAFPRSHLQNQVVSERPAPVGELDSVQAGLARNAIRPCTCLEAVCPKASRIRGRKSHILQGRFGCLAAARKHSFWAVHNSKRGDRTRLEGLPALFFLAPGGGGTAPRG